MPLDYNSLLLAIGFAGAGLAITMFGSWLSARTDGFLLTWSVGVALVVAHVFTYSAYVENQAALHQTIAFVLLLSGFSVLLGAARQFRSGKAPLRTMATLAASSALVLILPAWLGLTGIVHAVANLAAAGLMVATACLYWRGRAEAPGPIMAIAALYALTGLSFVPSALMPLIDGQTVLAKAPDNWAEDLNLFIAIAGITGIGALSLALNHSRAARSHRRDALTDSLTGLMNRRALFNRVGAAPFDRFTCVLLFDLDRFKRVNDHYGHSIGDEVLRRFALVMTECLRGNDIAARLGGEEFAAVMPRATTERAHQVAERIRKEFAELVIETEKGTLQCTVSVGIAFPTGDGRTFEQVLSDADKALYRAKSSGRNRVTAASLRLAG